MKISRNQETYIILLLRICTILLSAVSFWATAQGMIDYTFPQAWQAYAASLGIQGLLLGLNFSLPSFLRKCRDRSQKAVLYFLTIVILFCSSWFSYLYITEQAYGDSWKTERRLLAQAVYREELFEADAYIELYRQDVQNVLTDQIVNLYQQAMNMDQAGVSVSENLNWEEERRQYTAEDFAAKDAMSLAISAMENASTGEASQDVREQAADVLSGMQSNLQSETDRLAEQISNTHGYLVNAEESLRNAENHLNSIPAGVDYTSYQNTVQQAAKTYESLIQKLDDLESQHADYESALQRTGYYLTILGMAENGVSSYYVGATLREIQRELFKTSPDSEQMLESAANVFDRLQNAVDLNADSSEYQNILQDMNMFRQNLENYSTLKKADIEIQAQINRLADGSILSLENDDELSEWRKQFNELKSKITGLPIYSLRGENGSALTSFDRAASLKRLDQVIRRYLTEHNAAQEGLIYLISPYREAAVFSLFLALLLDISAFITGVIIDRVSYSSPNGEKAEEQPFNIVPGLNRYIFLTGEYTADNEITTYKAIENGVETEIKHPDPGLKAGFYLFNEARLCEVEPSLLLFKGTSGGPQDGIYTECVLHYEDSLLTLIQDEDHIFLGPLDANIPVFLLSEKRCNVIPSKNISDIHGQSIVISLNTEGTQITAIYIMEHDGRPAILAQH
jgi:hypothetical protein